MVAQETFGIDKFLNVLLNIGILANIFYLTRYFFNQITAYLSVIIFCLLPTNVFALIWILSELPYLFLALTGFSLSLNKKWFPIVGASILFASTDFTMVFASYIENYYSRDDTRYC